MKSFRTSSTFSNPLLVCAFAAACSAFACGGSSSDPSGTGSAADAGDPASASSSTTTETPDSGASASSSSSSTSGSDASTGTTTTTTGSTGGSTGGTTTTGGSGSGSGSGGTTTGGKGGTTGWMSVVGFRGFFSQTFDDVTWADATLATTSIRTISCVGTTVGWAAGDGGWIGHTADSGASWRAETSNTSVDLHGIRFASTTFGVVAGDGGTIEVTTDGGETWSAKSSGTSATLRGVALGYGAAFVVGDGATLVRSTDNGASWHASTIAGASDLTSVASDDTAGVVLAADSLGNVFASHDKGDTFVRELAGAGAGSALSSVSIAKDALHAIAVGASGHAFVRDGAGTWTAAATPTNVDLHAALVSEHGTLFLVAGEEGTLLQSADFGATWATHPLSTNAALYGLDDAW